MKLTPYQKNNLEKNIEIGLMLLSILEEGSFNLQSTLAPLLKMDVNSEAFKDFVNDLAGYNQLLDVIKIKLFWNGNSGSERVH